MAERPERGLLDTSVVVDLDVLSVDALPAEVSIPAITMAELAAGPAAGGSDVDERARRQDRLQPPEAGCDPLPFGVDAARTYGRVFAAVRAARRRPRRRSPTSSSRRRRSPKACRS